MTKQVDIQVLLRDETGEVIGAENANGYTEDEGVTVIIPLGYLPTSMNVPLIDPVSGQPNWVINVIPPPVTFLPQSLLNRVDDYDANTSTLTFQP